MIVRKVHLTAADILNLHITPVVIVPAPGAGLFIMPVDIAGHLNFNTTAFGGGGDLYQYIGPIANALSRPGIGQAVVNSAADAMQVGDLPQAFLNIAAANQFTNQPLNIFNIGAAFTLGDSTLDIYVAYELFQL